MVVFCFLEDLFLVNKKKTTNGPVHCLTSKTLNGCVWMVCGGLFQSYEMSLVLEVGREEPMRGLVPE